MNWTIAKSVNIILKRKRAFGEKMKYNWSAVCLPYFHLLRKMIRQFGQIGSENKKNRKISSEKMTTEVLK